MKTDRIDTWAADMKDSPGGLSGKLAALSEVGVNLEFVIARRCPDKKGHGVVFVAPIKGAKQCRAARKVGFERTDSLHSVRIEGANKAGVGTTITQALAAQGINLRGLSAAAIGRKFVAYIAVDTSAAATKARRVLAAL